MLADVARLPDARFTADDASALESLLALLRYAASQLVLVFQEARRVDYPAVAGAAREALADPESAADLARHLGVTVRHVLIDEFQDTSLEQFELLERLIYDWDPGDGRSLFVVGDPMQSIYQFREAEVGLFLRARREGIGRTRLEPLELQRNFRSAPRLVDWVNVRFARLFPSEDDVLESAVRHLPSTAAREVEPGTAAEIRLHGLIEPDAAVEATLALQIVRRARARTPGCSIAVLVAARSHAAAIAAMLRSEGFAVQGVDLVRLVDVPVVQDLAALTRAVANVADRVAWLAVLRAPWCGLQLADLTLLAAGPSGMTVLEAMDSAEVLATLSPDGQARTARLRGPMARALEQRFGFSLSRAVEAAWIALGGPSACATDQDLDAVQRYIDRLSDREQSREWAGVSDLDALLADLYAPSDAVADGAIQVMTIHRAKGLEFDVVILPGLHHPSPRSADGLLNWFDWPEEGGRTGILLAPIRAADSARTSPLVEWIRHQRARRIERERARVLYVACTRARFALHLIAALPGPDSAGEPRLPAAGSLLATLWPSLATEWTLAAAQDFPQDLPAAVPRSAVLPMRRLPLGWLEPQPPPAVNVDPIPVSTVAAAETPEFRWVGETARHVGTVVHAELEAWTRAAEIPDGNAREQRRARIQHSLAAEGVPPEDLQAAADRVLQLLHGVADDPAGRRIVAGSFRESHCELGLSGLYDGRLVSVVIDRCFIDESGVRWVIDYKTGDHQGGRMEDFIASEIERYRPQLRRYAALAAQMGPEPVRAALYFPLLAGRLVEIDTASTDSAAR